MVLTTSPQADQKKQSKEASDYAAHLEQQVADANQHSADLTQVPALIPNLLHNSSLQESKEIGFPGYALWQGGWWLPEGCGRHHQTLRRAHACPRPVPRTLLVVTRLTKMRS